MSHDRIERRPERPSLFSFVEAVGAYLDLMKKHADTEIGYDPQGYKADAMKQEEFKALQLLMRTFDDALSEAAQERKWRRDMDE